MKRPEKWTIDRRFLLHNNAPAHRSVLVKDVLAKNNVTTLDHPPLLTWLQLIFTCSLDWNQHWRDGCFIILLTSLRMRRKSWKCFHKMALTFVGRILYWHKGTILQKMWLKWLYCFVFLRKKMVPLTCISIYFVIHWPLCLLFITDRNIQLA